VPTLGGKGSKHVQPQYQRPPALHSHETAFAGKSGSLGVGRHPAEEADAKERKEAFRRIAKHITAGKAERTKYGFNSDTNGEIARAMEWAFKAGVNVGQSAEAKGKVSEK
jgi:hypothetical protein